MRAIAIAVLSLGVIGGFGSAFHNMRHHGSCGAGYGYDRGEARWVPGHWEEERAVTPPAPVAAPAPAPIVQQPPQIIVVQPQMAPAAAAPTIIVQPQVQAPIVVPVPAVKTETPKAPVTE